MLLNIDSTCFKTVEMGGLNGFTIAVHQNRTDVERKMLKPISRALKATASFRHLNKITPTQVHQV